MTGIAILNIDQGERKLSKSIADARVVLRASREERTTRTDKEGKFRFEAVPAGDYTIIVEAPAAYQPVKPKRIAVGKDACALHSIFTTRR